MSVNSEKDNNKPFGCMNQVLAALAVSLGSFAVGLGKGYSSPALASLKDGIANDFRVTDQESSWIASLSLLGALFGCIVGGALIQIGRKSALLIVSLPFSSSWFLAVFAQRVEMIYCASFMGGFCSAVILLAGQIYVSEISHPDIRGSLSALMKIFGNLGILTSFALGSVLNFRYLAAVAGGAPFLFFLAIIWIPETPSYLLYRGKEIDACKSLAWLRSPTGYAYVMEEIEILRRNIKDKENLLPKERKRRFPFRQLLITCGLMFFQKFSGVAVFFNYAVPIFKEIYGSSLDPHWAAIGIVCTLLIGSLTSGLFVDAVGRLPLLFLSGLFLTTGLVGFGFSNWMGVTQSVSITITLIPLSCVLISSLSFAIGINPISWLMVGELFPLEYRGFGSAVSTAFSYACAFAAVKSYVDIKALVGLHGTFGIYGGVSLAGLVFISCVVPETKGVGLEEMNGEAEAQPAQVQVQQKSSSQTSHLKEYFLPSTLQFQNETVGVATASAAKTVNKELVSSKPQFYKFLGNSARSSSHSPPNL